MNALHLALTVFGLLLVIAGHPLAGEPEGKRGMHGPSIFEQDLRERGVDLDTDSLIRLARVPAWGEASSPNRWGAIEMLGRRKVLAASAVLAEIVETDPDYFYRRAAALALARMHDPRGLPALRDLYDESDELVDRLFIAGRLVAFGDLHGRASIEEASFAEATLTRRFAVAPTVRLLEFPDTRARGFEMLERMAADPEPKVRYQVPLELGLAVERGEDPRSVVSLVRRMEEHDLDPAVRRLARGVRLHWEQAAWREGRAS